MIDCVPNASHLGTMCPREAELPAACRLPLSEMQGAGSSEGGCASWAAWGRAEHLREKGTCPAPSCVSSGGRGCRGLGPNGRPSWFRPLGGSGSEEGEQRQTSGTKLPVRMISYGSLGEGVGESYRSLRCPCSLGHEGNQTRTMEIHPCSKCGLSSYNVLAWARHWGCSSG